MNGRWRNIAIVLIDPANWVILSGRGDDRASLTCAKA